MADTEQSILDIGGIPEIDEDVEVFGMTQAEVDKTLTLEDCAADAKAVGDRFGNVEADIIDLDEKVREIENWTGEDILLKPDDEQTVSGAIEELQQQTIQNVYPIGSIYMSTSAEAPSFLGTEWEEILITATWSQLKSGMRSHAAGQSTGTVHFWMRTA